jgi:hypothetical protein
MFKRCTSLAVGALLAWPVVLKAQQTVGRRVYLVPGVHYGTPARASFSVTAFLDGRRGVIGKGNILILEGGRDAIKGQVGIANVSETSVGYSAQVGYLQTRKRPIEAMPNAQYAGAEFHLYLSVFNLGTGFYAPVGPPKGRRGLLHLSFGLGF